eukprot:2236734-Rhodomonas_salina.3
MLLDQPTHLRVSCSTRPAGCSRAQRFLVAEHNLSQPDVAQQMQQAKPTRIVASALALSSEETHSMCPPWHHHSVYQHRTSHSKRVGR